MREQESNNWAKAIFEEIMFKSFTKLRKDTNPEIEEALWTSSKVKVKRTVLLYIP